MDPEIEKEAMKRLTIGARKGGCGKTTSAINLASQYGKQGLKVLLVDSDPQGTATMFAGHDPDAIEQSASVIAAFLPEKFEAAPENLETPWPGVSLWASHPDLAGVGNMINIENLPGGEVRLARALDQVEGFDLAIIDCPPSMDKISVNAYCAADSVLVPVACDLASAGGLKRLFANIEMIREYQKPDLELLGVFGNMKRNTRHSRETMDALEKMLGELVFQTSVPLSVAVQDAQSAKAPLYLYDPDGAATKAFGELAGEVSRRMGLTVEGAVDVTA